jgi:hypothetical protein
VSANVPTSLLLSLSAGVGGNTSSTTGWVDAADGLYFPGGGPVFNLPEGYTAEIVGMNVVDNAVVPEPAVGALFACGASASALRRRNRILAT